MGFTPYFDTNIRQLRGPLPLTIFNKAWKNKAILYHAEKRPKFDESSSDRNRYTGLPYPSEWTQTFSEWTQNHHGFYMTLVNEYNYKKMARWLLAHKANADAILAEDGFMVALRYDIQVRTNAFAHRVTLASGRKSLVDISVLRPKIAQSCYTPARKFGELEFTDNPYTEGGARANWDPTTGSQKVRERVEQAPAARAPAVPAITQFSIPASLPSKPAPAKAPKGSNYKGSNYNANYKLGEGGSGSKA
ncbi:hypothetical protein MJO28_012204 [Puccinia striiformis f. sp. tritici]|nr:hypothetical protein MJO28_012204 [Puccinia striiformis f. sp. tritici]